MYQVSGTLLACIATVAAILGAILIKWGWWPRRRGSEPNCRKCGYLLIGINSERCPECGTALSKTTVVSDVRKRRRPLVLLGLALLFVAVTASGRLLWDVDWYHYKPTFLVLRDLQSPGWSAGDKALTELQRRDQAGQLSDSDLQRIIAVCLAEQASTRSGILTTRLMDYLGRLYKDGRLTDAQKQQVAKQSVVFILRVRPSVTLGDGISWEIDEIARVPQPFVLTVVGPLPETDEVDGQFSSGANTQSPGQDLSYIGNAPVEMCRGITRCNTVGTHQLVLSLRVRFRVASDADSSPPWQTYPLTAPFTAVAHQLPGDFSLVNDPSLGGAISASILPPRFTLTGDYLEGTIVVGKMPVNVAFNVFARFGADEYEIGTIVRPKNEGGTREFHFDVILNHTDATTRQSIFDLILVSNEKLGRQTVNMHDIWNGKLVIPNIYFSASSLYSTH